MEVCLSSGTSHGSPPVKSYVLMEVTICNQPSDEVLRCFAVIDMMPRVSVVVTGFDCNMVGQKSLHPKGMLLEIAIFVGLTCKCEGCYMDKQGFCSVTAIAIGAPLFSLWKTKFSLFGTLQLLGSDIA